MDFDLGYNEADASESPKIVDVELPRPPVCKKNGEILKKYAPIYQEEYYAFKESFLKWVLTTGKRPRAIG